LKRIEQAPPTGSEHLTKDGPIRFVGACALVQNA